MTDASALFLTDTAQIRFLQHRRTSVLESSWKLPLSLETYGLLLKLGLERVLPYTDFVDFADRKRWYLDTGLQYARTWLSEMGLSLQIGGVDLAQLDAPCQFLLFTHLHHIESTAAVMLDALPEVELFYVLQRDCPLVKDFYFDSDVPSAILTSLCERAKRRVKSIRVSGPMGLRHANFPIRPITDVTETLSVPLRVDKSEGVGSGFVPATVANAEVLLQSLEELTSPMLFSSTWDRNARSSRHPNWTLSAAGGVWSDAIAQRLARVHAEFLSRRSKSSLPDLIIRNPRLDFQFEYIIRRRWMAYANMIHRGIDFVRENPLALLIQSDVFTAEGAVLSRLYRRAATPVLIALHSAYPCDENWASWDKTDCAIAPTRTAADRLISLSGMTEVFVAPDLIAHRYQSVRADRQRDQSQKRALGVLGNRKLLVVLVNVLELDCVPFLDFRAHFEAVAVLAEIAHRLKDRCAFLLRTKPGWSEDESSLYASLGGFAFDEDLHSPLLPLPDLIAMADCVVGVNLPTGGYYEVLRGDCPLIHFEVADVAMHHPELPPEAVLHVNNPTGLLSAIEAFLFDDEERKAAIARQRNFVDADSERSAAGPTLSVRDVLEIVLKRKGSSALPLKAEGKSVLDAWSIADSNEPAGYVDDILWAPSGRVRVIGWARDPRTDEPAQQIHIFLGSNRIGTDTAGGIRPDVAEKYKNDKLLRSGFNVAFPVRSRETIPELDAYAEVQDGKLLKLERSWT